MLKRILSALLLGLAAVTAQADIVNVDNAELARLAASGVPVIDIRTEAEWKESGVVPGAKLMTFFDEQGKVDAPAWLARLKAEAGDGKPVVLICRSGNRTKAVSQFLSRDAGYAKVYNAQGGMKAWVAEGRPVVPAASVLAGCTAGKRC